MSWESKFPCESGIGIAIQWPSKHINASTGRGISGFALVHLSIIDNMEAATKLTCFVYG
jgi:hypothetical protein